MTTLKQEGSQFIHRQEVSAHSVSPSVSIRRTCWFKNETSWDLHTVWSFSSLYFDKMQGLSQDFSEILWSWVIFFFPKQKMVLCFWSVSLIMPNHLCHLLLLYEYKVQRMYIITVFIWKARYVTSQFDPVNINGDICTSTLFTPQWQFPPSMWMLQKKLLRNGPRTWQRAQDVNLVSKFQIPIRSSIREMSRTSQIWRGRNGCSFAKISSI